MHTNGTYQVFSPNIPCTTSHPYDFPYVLLYNGLVGGIVVKLGGGGGIILPPYTYHAPTEAGYNYGIS